MISRNRYLTNLYSCAGGKLDDITVIVGHVVHEQSPKDMTVEKRIPTVTLGDLRVDVDQPSSVPETFPDGLSEGWA